MANDQPPYYIGAHFINDATWDCESIKIKNLELSNNCYCDGFLIKARSLITIGGEVFWVMMIRSTRPRSKNSSDNNYWGIIGNIIHYKHTNNILLFIEI